jgi:hypothetical protein
MKMGNQTSGGITATVITASVALVVGLLAGGVALWNEARKRRQERENERQRLQAQRDEARLSAIRLSAADAFKEMFVLQHEVEWLTWHARYEPKAVNEDMRRDYNQAVHVSIPKLLGALAVLASLDETTFRKLKPIADELFEFEGTTARAAIGLSERKTREAALRRLAFRFDRAYSLWIVLPKKMAEVMKQVGVQ